MLLILKKGLHELAELHHKLGQYQLAEEYNIRFLIYLSHFYSFIIFRALKIRRAVFGEHIDVARSISNLAQVVFSQVVK